MGTKTPTPAPWYVTGLLEGQGVFTYSRSGRHLTVVFALRQPAGDRRLLDELRDFFGGAGRLYTGGYWKVTRPRDLLRIVGHIDAFPLRGDRRRAYGVWRQMVFVKAAHLGRRAPRDLVDLARELSATGSGRRQAS